MTFAIKRFDEMPIGGNVMIQLILWYTSRSTRRCPGSNVSLCMANSFWKGFFFPSLTVAAIDALQTLFRAPLTPGVHPGGRNIAYDLALVKLGPHTKFGEDCSNGVDFYTGHTNKQTNTPRFTFIYKIFEIYFAATWLSKNKRYWLSFSDQPFKVLILFACIMEKYQ